tara:strand:- start:376 stop:633 length:258 start_codon:yes stop_codon:yes gene_type:complete
MYEYYVIYGWSDCPYCVEAKEILMRHEKQFMLCLLDESPALLNMLKEKHGWETVPMIIHYTKNITKQWTPEFVGGCSNLKTLFPE